MKIKIILALIFYVLGIVRIIDWIIFWDQHKELALKNRNVFITKYVERFPDYIKAVFTSKYQLDTVLSIVLFVTAGLIFLKKKNLFYKVLAITSFVFAFWNLFTL